MRYAVLLAALVLSGCAERMIARAHELCSRYGFPAGSPDHARCVQATVSEMDERMRVGFARMGAAGTVMMQNSQPTYTPPSTLNCTTYRQGIYVQTRCY